MDYFYYICATLDFNMNILRIYPTSINRRFIDEAVDILRSGGIIIYPTDTLYALGCDALNNGAVERVCRIKGINPQKQSLSIVCSSLSMASDFARIDNKAFALLKHNLPGPFTFILPASTRLPKLFKGRKQAGIRIPANPITEELTTTLGSPILSASVDFDGDDQELISNPEEIAMKYEGKGVDLLLNGGQGGVIPSAIVDLTDSTDPIVLREGPKPIEI